MKDFSQNSSHRADLEREWKSEYERRSESQLARQDDLGTQAGVKSILSRNFSANTCRQPRHSASAPAVVRLTYLMHIPPLMSYPANMLRGKRGVAIGLYKFVVRCLMRCFILCGTTTTRLYLWFGPRPYWHTYSLVK